MQYYNVYLDNKKVGISVLSDRGSDDARPCYSQPAPAAIPFSVSIPPNESDIHSFTQPTQVEHLLLSSQIQTSQTVSTTVNVIIKKTNKMENVSICTCYFLEFYSEISQENDKIYCLFIV